MAAIKVAVFVNVKHLVKGACIAVGAIAAILVEKVWIAALI